MQKEIAALAARRMAEFGDDCAQAKRKAAAEHLGDPRRAGVALPDDEQVAEALREHLRTFDPERHASRIEFLRRRALAWMERLAAFEPHLAGAVLNGSATRYSVLQLQLFAESGKDVEMQLLSEGVSFRVEAPESPDGHVLEFIGLHDEACIEDSERSVAGADDAPGTPGRHLPIRVLLTVFDPKALRIAPKGRPRNPDPNLHAVERAGRANAAMLRELLADAPEPAKSMQWSN